MTRASLDDNSYLPKTLYIACPGEPHNKGLCFLSSHVEQEYRESLLYGECRNQKRRDPLEADGDGLTAAVGRALGSGTRSF